MAFSKDCPLLTAIKNNNNEEARNLIMQNTSLYNIVDATNKNTLLHYAAEYKNHEIVQFLINSGSNVDARNGLQQTPLIRSLKLDFPCKKVIEVLLEGGAQVDRNELISISSSEWLNENSSFEKFEIVKVLIERINDMFYFPVLRRGQRNVIELLLKTNINVSQADHYGKTLVHELAKNENPGVIELLADKDFDANLRDVTGRSPLMYAVQYGIHSGIELLLNKGADIEAKGRDNNTALYTVISHGSDEETERKVQVLLEHGANAQVESTDNFKTIFDIFIAYDDTDLAELPLAYLALKERTGMSITDLIRSKIYTSPRFKAYFDYCHQQLSRAVYASMTLLNIITASDRHLERLFRNDNLTQRLIDLRSNIPYFDRILRKRLLKAYRLAHLHRESGQIVSHIIQMDYDSFHCIIDKVVDCLNENDREYLILIEDELP